MYKYSTHQVWKSCYLPNHLADRGEISNTMIFNEFGELPPFYCYTQTILLGALNQENIWGFKKVVKPWLLSYKATASYIAKAIPIGNYVSSPLRITFKYGPAEFGNNATAIAQLEYFLWFTDCSIRVNQSVLCYMFIFHW